MVMDNLRDLQREVGEWHSRVYANASLAAIGLKLGEEAGEVCGAVDRIIYEGGWEGDLANEAGDVVIVLAALFARLGLDLELAVASRWEQVRHRHDESQSGTHEFQPGDPNACVECGEDRFHPNHLPVAVDPPDHMHADYCPQKALVRSHVANAHRGIDPDSRTVVDDHRRAHGKPPEKGDRR